MTILSPSIRFSFDTSAFVFLEHEAGLSQDDALDAVRGLTNANRLFVCFRVMEELSDDDSLFVEILNRLDPDYRVMKRELALTHAFNIQQSVPGLTDPRATHSQDDADPWVLALAFDKKLTVVHKEDFQYLHKKK